MLMFANSAQLYLDVIVCTVHCTHWEPVLQVQPSVWSSSKGTRMVGLKHMENNKFGCYLAWRL